MTDENTVLKKFEVMSETEVTIGNLVGGKGEVLELNAGDEAVMALIADGSIKAVEEEAAAE